MRAKLAIQNIETWNSLRAVQRVAFAFIFAISYAQGQSNPPPTYFEIQMKYDSTYTNTNNGGFSILYCAGTEYIFGPFQDYHCETQGVPPRYLPVITKTSADGSLSIDTTGYGAGTLLANLGIGPNGVSGTLSGGYSWVNNTFTADSYSLGLSATLKTYVRGAAGTKFHLDYAFNAQSQASISRADCNAWGMSGGFSSPVSVTVAASQAGNNNSNAGSTSPQGGIDGTTGTDTRLYLGEIYTLAHSLPIALGFNSNGSKQCNPAIATGQIQATGNLNLAVKITQTAHRDPTATIAITPTTTPAIGQPMVLDGSGSQAFGTGIPLAAYQWTIQKQGGTDTLVGATAQYSWNQTGIYQVTLTVTDSDGLTGTTTTSVKVSNCSVSLSPTSSTFDSNGGAGSIGVITSPSGCEWNATSNNSDWLSITSGSAGSGAGTVNYFVKPNPTPNTRTGTLTIGDQTYTVTENAYTCTISLAPPSASFGVSGGAGTVVVNTLPNACSWTALSDSAWLRVTFGGSGVGSGVIGYAVDPNPNSAQRRATLTAATPAAPASASHAVIQEGSNNSCDASQLLSSQDQCNKPDLSISISNFTITPAALCSGLQSWWPSNFSAVVMVTISNLGDVASPAADWDLFLAKNAAKHPWSYSVGSIAAHSSITATKLIRLGIDFDWDFTGEVTFGAEIDPNNVIDEISEANNVDTRAVILVDPRPAWITPAFLPGGTPVQNTFATVGDAEQWLRGEGFTPSIPPDTGWTKPWSTSVRSRVDGEWKPYFAFRIHAGVSAQNPNHPISLQINSLTNSFGEPYPYAVGEWGAIEGLIYVAQFHVCLASPLPQ